MLLAAALIAVVAAWLDPLPPPFSGQARASDGDSLRIRNDRIRLLGIDAPELDQVCWDGDDAEWACGRAARGKLAELLGTRTECQAEGTDRFGRSLATCRVGEIDVAEAMVEAGLAIATDRYFREQSAAKAAGLGIWRGRFVDPKTWRDAGPTDEPPQDVFEQLWNGWRELTGARTLR